MKFKVEFDTDNDAFAGDGWGGEVRILLEKIGYEAQLSFPGGGKGYDVPVMDRNGNRIGRAWTEE